MASSLRAAEWGHREAGGVLNWGHVKAACTGRGAGTRLPPPLSCHRLLHSFIALALPLTTTPPTHPCLTNLFAGVAGSVAATAVAGHAHLAAGALVLGAGVDQAVEGGHSGRAPGGVSHPGLCRGGQGRMWRVRVCRSKVEICSMRSAEQRSGSRPGSYIPFPPHPRPEGLPGRLGRRQTAPEGCRGGRCGAPWWAGGRTRAGEEVREKDGLRE